MNRITQPNDLDISLDNTLICNFYCLRPAAYISPLNAQLNPICHLLALLGAHHILCISRIRVKLKLRNNVPFIAHLMLAGFKGNTNYEK
jgi:hypothetical protein